MVSSWHQIICSQRTVGPLLFHFDNNTRSVPHFNQSRARPSRRHHLFSFECGGGWIKTLAQWQNARLKYFNFPEDKLENCSRRRCCLCFLIILTLACSMWESVVNSSSWRERASERVSKWVNEWAVEKAASALLYLCPLLFTAPQLHCWWWWRWWWHWNCHYWTYDCGREWEPRAALCNITYILHYCPGQATIPLYLSGLAQNEVLCVPV